MPHIGNHVDAIFLPESVNTSTTLRINGGDLHLDDNKKILLGQSDDLQIYHNGSHSVIADAGTGALRILSNNVRIRPSSDVGQIANFTEGGAVELYYDNSKVFETTSTGIDVTGNDIKLLGPTSGSTFTTSTLTLRGFRQSAAGQFGNVDFKNIDANSSNTEYLAARISAQVPSGADGGELKFFVTPHNSTTLTSTAALILHDDSSAEFASDVSLPDDAKLRLGTSGGGILQIYTNGTNSFFKQVSGDLKYELADQFIVQKDSGDEPIAVFTADGSVELYHDSTKAFETTSTGIDVPLGTITGPATLNIDPAAVGDNTGTVVIKGNLQVDGTTTTINSTTLTVDDKNIVLASGAADSAAADGAGITIDGANQTFIYESANDSFKTSTRLGIRATPNINSNLRIGGNAGGEGNGTTYYGILNNPVVQSDVTTVGYYNFVQVKTANNSGTAYTISNIEGYTATVGSGTIHADSTITNLVGFNVKSSWTEGTNNYGFKGNIDAAANTNRWNVYMEGTAPNYFAGNVGIGTNNPTGILHIAGNSSFQEIKYGHNAAGYFLSNTEVNRSGANQAIHNYHYRWNGTKVAQMSVLTGDDTTNKDNGYFVFETASAGSVAERLRITADGNVGIGTNNPGDKLDVSGDASIRSVLKVGASDAVAEIKLMQGTISPAQIQADGDNTEGYLAFFTRRSGANYEQMRIDKDGNVGIGTNDPLGTLHIESTSPVFRMTDSNAATNAKNWDIKSNTANLLRIQAINDDGTSGGGNLFDFQRSGNAINDFLGMAGGTYWFTVQNSTQSVGIGTTVPDRKLHVNGDTRLDGIVQIGDGTSTSYQLNIETIDSGNNDNTRAGVRLDINGWKNDQGTKYGLLMDIDSVATDDFTANRSKYGLYIPWNCYVPENAGVDAGDGSTHQANFYGQYTVITLDDNPVSTYNAGKANQVYGSRSKVRIDHGGGAINVRGIDSMVQAANDFNSTANTVDKAYGLHSYVVNDSDTTTFTAAYGTYSWVNQDNNGTITDAYGVYSRVDRDGGTGTNAYGLYCSIEGTWGGVKYGVYSTGETSNYFSGNVGINADAGETNARLHIRSASTHLNYGIHFQNINDQGKPDALALTNMYDRDIGITFRSGDSNGANQAKRWTIWNDAANSGGDNNRFNISPGAGNASLGITILQNNNVGISTASPTEKLHVEGGSILVEHNAPFIKFAETGLTGTPVFWAGMDAGNFSIRLDNTAPYPFRIRTKGTNNDSIDFVAIGGDTIQDVLKVTAHGTNPTYLDLKGNDANARMRYWEGTTERWNIGYDTSVNAFTFYDTQSSGTRMFLYDNPNNGIVIGQADNGGLTWPSTDGGGGTVQQAALRVDGGGHPALFCYNDEQSGDPVAVFAKGNEADDNQVVIIAGDGDETEELLDIRSSTDPPNTSGLLSFAPNNANSRFRVYGDGRVYSSYRVGIGTTQPSTDLQVVGQIEVGAASSTSNSLVSIFHNSNGGCIEAHAANDNTSKKSLSLNAFGGNVGIGNDSPNTLLHLGSSTANANAYITFGKRSSTSETNLPFIGHVDADGNSQNDLGIGACSTGGAVILYAGNSNPFTSGSERLRVTAGGNIGIGTTNPSEKLHVHGASVFGGTNDSGRAAQISTNGQGFFRYDDNSNTNPLTIENRATNATAGHGASIRFRFGDSAADGAHNAGKLSFLQSNSWTSSTSTHDAKFVVSIAQNDSLLDRLVIEQNGTVTMSDAEIDPGNHIEVGRGSGSVAMTINDGKGNANLTFNHRDGVPDNTSTGQSACRIETSVDNAGARMYFELGDSTSVNTSVNLTEVLDLDIGLVEVTGDLDVSGSLSQNTSDGRLKENLVHISTPLDKVDQLHGYTFDWKAECADVGFTPKIQTNDIGLIAQDVQAVMPQAVTPAPFDHELSEDGTEDVSVSGENYLTVQYERLVPLLVEAIKELRQEVETLKAQIGGS